MDKYRENKASPLGGTLLEVDQQTYGESVPDTGTVLAKRLPIMSISPDLRQPRRVVPHSVRGDWNGDPEEFVSVLGVWHLLVEEKLGHSIDLPAALRGSDDAMPEKSDDAVVAEYVESIKLAQTLLVDGQRESIEVWRRDPSGKRFVIQDGERRWVAHQMLNLHVSGDFRTILAVEKDRNVWAQATRNGAHRALNAISMARQIALLLIAMYEGDAGVNFDSFESMVLPGECDRKYYAQVARGDLYPVKRGMLERVLSVTGLKTRSNVSNYRSLLDLDDETWLQADAENWALNAILETRKPLKPEVDVFNALNTSDDDVSTIVDVVSENKPSEEALVINAASAESGFHEGDLVLTNVQGFVVELCRMNDRSFVTMLHGNSADGVGFTLDAASVTRIDATTPLNATQALDVAEFMRRRSHKDADESSATALLTPAERDALDRAWGVMHRADPKFKGWYPAPPVTTDAVKALLERGFLETERRMLWGKEQASLRITHAGCRALGRSYNPPGGASEAAAFEAPPADYGDLPKAKAPVFDYGSYVYHKALKRVGRVHTTFVESQRQANGVVNTEWVTVFVLEGFVAFSAAKNWLAADLRRATEQEIAFWTEQGGIDDAQTPNAQGVATESAHEDEPGRAAGGAVEADTGRPAAAQLGETTLFADWATDTGLGELLRLLHALASEPTKTRIHDLLTMTESDLRDLIDVTPVGASPGGLNWLLATSEGLVSELVGRVLLKPLNEYVMHLKALGKEIDEDVRG